MFNTAVSATTMTEMIVTETNAITTTTADNIGTGTMQKNALTVTGSRKDGNDIRTLRISDAVSSRHIGGGATIIVSPVAGPAIPLLAKCKGGVAASKTRSGWSGMG